MLIISELFTTISGVLFWTVFVVPKANATGRHAEKGAFWYT